MSNKTVGFDIGARTVHVAVNDGKSLRVVNEHTPEGLVREGQILSLEAMSDFLRTLRREQKLHVKKAALVLPASQCYCRRLTTAYMSAEQLAFNLPYEFRDFIAGDKEDYYYDYAVVNTVTGEDGKPRELDLMAAAVRRDLMLDLEAMFKQAGFKLETAMPEELAYINLMRAGGLTDHGHCLLDLGHSSVKFYIFEGDRFENIRALDFGLEALDRAVADHFSVDEHVASSYLQSDYNGCTRLPQCIDIYNSIAVEVTKAVNFYRFNSGGGEVEHLHLCGGGTRLWALVDTLQSQLSIPVEGINECWPQLEGESSTEAAVAAAAVGAAIQ